MSKHSCPAKDTCFTVGIEMTRIVAICLLIIFETFSLNKSFCNESKIERIAVHFTEKILSGDTEDMPAIFSMTDEIKASFLKTNSFKEWTNAISEWYGEIVERESVKTMHEGSYYHTLIPYKFEKGRITFEVFITQQKVVYGFTWSHQNGGKQNNNSMQSDNAKWKEILPVLLVCFSAVIAFPIVLFLIVFLGEKWRVDSLQNKKWEEDINISTTDVSVPYRESQNPLWPYVLLLAICLFIFCPVAIASLLQPGQSIYLTLSISGAMQILVLSIGLIFGFSIEVNNKKLVIRMGIIRLKVLTVLLEDIKSVENVTFSPLADFGGFGIRTGGRDIDKAYFMSGTQGVKIVTNKNKKYLIGSDSPNVLHKMIRVRCYFE